jgi:hypothetical protein
MAIETITTYPDADTRTRRASPEEPPPAIPGWLTEAQQAMKDHVNIATLRRRRVDRYGPMPIKFGRRFFYREDATERWLEEQEAANAAD